MTVRKPFLLVLWGVLALYLWLSLFQSGCSIKDQRGMLRTLDQPSAQLQMNPSVGRGGTSATQFLENTWQQASEGQVQLSNMTYHPSDDTYQLILRGSETGLLGYYSRFEKQALYHQITGMRLAEDPEEEEGFVLTLFVRV